MNSYEQATQEVSDAFKALCKGRVEAAVKAEREACAKVVEEYPNWIGMTAKAEISGAIRARSQA